MGHSTNDTMKSCDKNESLANNANFISILQQFPHADYTE